MAFNPEFIKPVRLNKRPIYLTTKRVFQNQRRNIETTVVFDLNILSKMKDVIKGAITFPESGLVDVVKKLNSLPLYLSPGFCFNEVSEECYEELYVCWEKFMQKYCPDYFDAPNALGLPQDKKYKRIFNDLPPAEKYFHASSYLSMLLIRSIYKNNKNLSPTQKFDHYVNYMHEKANMLTAIEAEIAKYCFCDREKYKDIEFKIFCKNIKDNFLKKGSKSYELKNALNSASDVVYYRAVAAQSNEKLDNITQDTWLLSADEGLKCLAQAVYFIPNYENSDSKAVTLFRNETQKKCGYWEYCDTVFSFYNKLRNPTPMKPILEDEFNSKMERILRCTAEIEAIL